MDRLPSELKAHILTFLPEDDVIRFNELNSTFAQLIRMYRRKLKAPEIEVRLCGGAFSPEVVMDVYNHKKNTYYGLCYNRITPVDIHDSDSERFFERFFGRKSLRWRLECLSWMLVELLRTFGVRISVANIATIEQYNFVVTCVGNAIIHDKGTSKRRILEITLPANAGFWNNHTQDLLKTVNDFVEVSPRITIVLVIVNYASIVGRLYRKKAELLSEIADKFQCLTIRVGFYLMGDMMATLSKEWVRNPFPIRLFIRANRCYSKKFEGISGDKALEEARAEFHVTIKNPEQFHTKNEDKKPSWVLFEHRQSGMKILFTRDPNYYKNLFDEKIRIEMSTMF